MLFCEIRLTYCGALMHDVIAILITPTGFKFLKHSEKQYAYLRKD